MPSMSLHPIIPFYTFVGILPVKEIDQKFQISKVFSVFNLLKMFFVWGFAYFVLSDTDIHKSLMISDMHSMNKYSTFSKVLAVISIELVQTITLAVSFLQFFNRSKIVDFMNQTGDIIVDEFFANRFRCVCKRLIFQNLFNFLVISSIQLLTLFRMSFLSIVSFSILIQPYCLMSAFLSLMKTFEVFIALSLKDFHRHLSLVQLNSKDIDVEVLLLKYQKIYELNLELNKTFGLQVTLTTISVTVLTTIQVLR